MNPQHFARGPAAAAVDEVTEPLAGLSALAQERLPATDLWAGIESRLSRPQARRRREPSLWPYALAASVCLAMVTGLLLRAASSTEGPLPAGAVVATFAAEPLADPDGRHPYANGEHAVATAPLSPRTLRTLRSESLDNAPVMVAEQAESNLWKATYSSSATSRSAHSQEAILRANLRLVVQAEREVRRALRSDPESTSLQSLLVVAQEKRAVLTNLLIHEQD